MNRHSFAVIFLCMTATTTYGWWPNVMTSIQNITTSLQALDAWKLPDKRLRFDQVTYLGTHNSFSNLQEGFIYCQQYWSFDNQLKHGIRNFSLDLWYGGETIYLCHGECANESTWARLALTSPKTLRSYLVKIKAFLDAHPEEIISLSFERYVSNEDVYKDILSVPGLFEYVLTPEFYDPLKNDGLWPVIGGLVSMGKRLIIFDTGSPEKYGFGTRTYLIRNMYGKLSINGASEVRDKPSGAILFDMSYFGTVTSPLPIHNSPATLQQLLNACQEKNLIPVGKSPNFVALDNVHLGNAMRWVNALNAAAAKQL